MKATAKCFKREVEQVFRSSRIAKTSSENKTSNFCFHFSIIPNRLTSKRCANCSGGKLVGFMWRLQEKYLKFVVRCSRGPYTCKTGQLDVTDWTRTTRGM